MKAESRIGGAGTPAGDSAHWVRQTRSEQTRGRSALFRAPVRTASLHPEERVRARGGGYNRQHCPGGETGRRKGLKIPRLRGRTGSSPVPGTKIVSDSNCLPPHPSPFSLFSTLRIERYRPVVAACSRASQGVHSGYCAGGTGAKGVSDNGAHDD